MNASHALPPQKRKKEHQSSVADEAECRRDLRENVSFYYALISESFVYLSSDMLWVIVSGALTEFFRGEYEDHSW